MAAAPGASIVVCTRNRARSLERCIAAIRRHGGESVTEIVVVDDASSDETPAVLARLASGDPRIVAVREERVGAAVARNRGWRTASAARIVWVDDDVEPAPGWLEPLVAALDDETVAAVAGPIVPRFEEPPPPWLAPHHLSALACFDLGSERRDVTDFPYFFSANLAVRRHDLERLGGFDERLGRKGPLLLSGEDTDLCERLIAGGGRLVYEPRALVHHWIGPERLTRAYFRRRDFWTGRTRARQLLSRARPATAALQLAGKISKLPMHAVAWALASIRGDVAGRADRSRSVMATLGFATELAAFARGHEPEPPR